MPFLHTIGMKCTQHNASPLLLTRGFRQSPLTNVATATTSTTSTISTTTTATTTTTTATTTTTTTITTVTLRPLLQPSLVLHYYSN